jgi:hypothetical protein
MNLRSTFLRTRHGIFAFRAAAAHGQHQKRIGAADANWPAGTPSTWSASKTPNIFPVIDFVLLVATQGRAKQFHPFGAGCEVP